MFIVVLYLSSHWLRGRLVSLRTADVFTVVASLSPFSEEEKQRPEIRLRFAGYRLVGYLLDLSAGCVISKGHVKLYCVTACLSFLRHSEQLGQSITSLG